MVWLNSLISTYVNMAQHDAIWAVCVFSYFNQKHAKYNSKPYLLFRSFNKNVMKEVLTMWFGKKTGS